MHHNDTDEKEIIQETDRNGTRNSITFKTRTVSQELLELTTKNGTPDSITVQYPTSLLQDDITNEQELFDIKDEW